MSKSPESKGREGLMFSGDRYFVIIGPEPKYVEFCEIQNPFSWSLPHDER